MSQRTFQSADLGGAGGVLNLDIIRGILDSPNAYVVGTAELN
jgi:hypothetical protein